jgi:hypothetical protein
MTAVALFLIGLAMIDGACSGVRSSLGRAGLVRHSALDRRSAARGVARVVALLLPAAFAWWTDIRLLGTGVDVYARAGEAMLVVLLPYAVVVALALVAYGTLGWRQKYLAMALILGPLTLVRPLIAIGSGLAGACVTARGMADVTITLAVAAVLTVEPLMGRRWSDAPNG